MNNIKTIFLFVVLTVVLVSAGGAFGGKQGMAMALVFAFGMNIFAYWYSDRVVLRMYRAREVTEPEAPELFGMVRMLARRAEMPLPKVYIIDSEQPNAFATGRNPSHAAVAVTTGIMRVLSSEELMGVMAHELSHVKNRDILISTVAAALAGAISYLAYMGMFFGGGDDDEGGGPLGMILMIVVAPLAAMIVQMAISRSREYEADRGGADIAGNPRFLSGALRKLHMASRQIPMRQATPATSHMFIVNPLRGGGISRLFSTHPPIEERIRRLEEDY